MSLPLATSTWDQKEIEAINRVIKSDHYTMGKEVEKFEKDFANYVGSKYCVMSNSGSSANLLAIAALIYSKRHDFSPGDEVIVPAVSWSTTYFPLHQYGLKMKFVDIDIDTLNLNLNILENAITNSTKAILGVNLLGNPIDFEKLQKICENHDLVLIEDNCESLGATLKNKQAGTFGVIGTYSTFFSHHISTMEGGLTVTDCEELYHLMLSIRAHGWTRNLPKNNLITEKLDDEFTEKFRFIIPGYNLRPLEMAGAIGQEQIKKLPKIIEGRKLNAKRFIELFQMIEGITIQKETGESSWFGFSLILGKNIERVDLIEELKAKGVEVRPIVTGNFVRNPVIKFMNYEIHGELTNANIIHDNGLFFGNHHFDITEELEKIANIVKNHLEELT